MRFDPAHVAYRGVDLLRREGIDAVFLEGGLKAWTEGGRPVVNARSSATYRIADADIDLLRRFVSERGKISPRRNTGTCPKMRTLAEVKSSWA